MSRPSAVTLDEVRTAIDTLKAQGVTDPGVHRIRALIGHGSVTTINKLKHQIRAEELNRMLPGTTKPMPDPITEAAAQLWETLNAEIDRIDQQREAEVRDDLEQLNATHEKTLEEKNALAIRIDELGRQLAEATVQTENLTAERDQIAAARDTAQQENRVLQERMAAIEKERDNTIEQMATLSRHTAEREAALGQQIETAQNERLQERAQAEDERKRLEEDVQHWRGQFAQQNTFLSDQIKAREDEIQVLRAQADELQQQRAQEHKEHDAALTQLAEQREARARAEQAIEDLTRQLKEIPALREQCTQLTQQRDSFDASLRQCREELAATRARLQYKEDDKK